MLNLGHTIGHAIEAATGFARYSHGEAVGLGLRAALWLSERLAGPRRRCGRARAGAARRPSGLPERLTGVDRRRRVRLIARDKKAGDGRRGFVLLEALGRPVAGRVVPPELQREVVAWLLTR